MRMRTVNQFKTYNFAYMSRAYRGLLRQFLKESAIHGLRALLATPKWRYAKIVWLLFLIYAIIQTHVIISNLIINYLEQPTEIHMSTRLVHVLNTPFPGVAVCSGNKFSRSKLLKYAELVFTSVSISSAMRMGIVHQFKTYNFAYMSRAYRGLLRQFLKESAIHGLRTLLATPKWRYAKIVWLLFLIYAIIQTHVIISNLIINYLEQPTEIHMSTRLVHVLNTPFPGVAVCSGNKFSRSKLLKYAELVYEAQQRYQPELLAANATEMANHLLLLGGFYIFPFYDYPDADDTRAEKLHNILLRMYNGTGYPTRSILFDLAPDCENLVVRGMVFGEHVNTSEYFQKRITTSSVCCMFNYHRESYSPDPKLRVAETAFKAKLKNVTFEANSILNSVHFVLQDDPDERTFTEMNSDAYQVYLFPKEDYPFLQSDTDGEVFVDRNSIVEISVQPTFYGSTKSMRLFSPTVRKCYFLEEGRRLLNLSFYSFDECLLICRMQSMVKYCGCVNPPLPAALINATECGLLQLGCLSLWRSVWNGWTYFSYIDENEDDGLTVEQCAHCFPTCTGVNHNIEINVQPLRNATADTVFTFGLLKGLTSSNGLAVIRLFFKQRTAESTVSDVVGSWLVLLNRFGGIMSLMYGFSIISYIEVVYYLSGKWFYVLCKACQLQKQPRNQPQALTVKRKNKHRQEHSMEYSLYWQELKPKILKFNSNAKYIGLRIPEKY